MSRPFQITTNAAVLPSGGSNAASTASLTFAMLSWGGSGSFGSTSPIGQACVEAPGKLVFSLMGWKSTEALPTGSVTHP